MDTDLHVYDWIDSPAENAAEKDAKEWLHMFTTQKTEENSSRITRFLERYRLTVEWKGKRCTCCGASRMGDVWLRTEGSQNYYDHRVPVSELSNWKRIVIPKSQSC